MCKTPLCLLYCCIILNKGWSFSWNTLSYFIRFKSYKLQWLNCCLFTNIISIDYRHVIQSLIRTFKSVTRSYRPHAEVTPSWVDVGVQSYMTRYHRTQF